MAPKLGDGSDGPRSHVAIEGTEEEGDQQQQGLRRSKRNASSDVKSTRGARSNIQRSWGTRGGGGEDGGVGGGEGGGGEG